MLYRGRIARLTEHDDIMKLLLRGAPRLGLALGPASAGAGPVRNCKKNQTRISGHRQRSIETPLFFFSSITITNKQRTHNQKEKYSKIIQTMMEYRHCVCVPPGT